MASDSLMCFLKRDRDKVGLRVYILFKNWGWVGQILSKVGSGQFFPGDILECQTVNFLYFGEFLGTDFFSASIYGGTDLIYVGLRNFAR